MGAGIPLCPHLKLHTNYIQTGKPLAVPVNSHLSL